MLADGHRHGRGRPRPRVDVAMSERPGDRDAVAPVHEVVAVRPLDDVDRRQRASSR
jgi:hypothetical protein